MHTLEEHCNIVIKRRTNRGKKFRATHERTQIDLLDIFLRSNERSS